MALDQNAELLGRVPLFSGLSTKQLMAIVNTARKTFFEAGATIVKHQAKGRTAYLLLSGSASTRPHKKSPIEKEKLGAGVLVGEMVMLTDTIYGGDVIAEERVRALSIDRDDFYQLLEENPAIAHNLAEKITERLIFLARDLRELDARFSVIETALDDAFAMAS